MDFSGKMGAGGHYGRVDQSCVVAAPVPCAFHGHGRALVGWTLQLQGGLGMGWAGMCTALCCWQLLGCTWKDLAPSPALTVLGTAQPCQPSWLFSAQILDSQGFPLTEAPGGILSHPHHSQGLLGRTFHGPAADPASHPQAVHFWVFPWFYCIALLQDMGLVFFLGLLFPVQRGWVPVVCL